MTGSGEQSEVDGDTSELRKRRDLPIPVVFALAMLGVVLVAIVPNPPVTGWNWVLIVGGASLTAFVTAYACRNKIDDNSTNWGERAKRVWQRLRKHGVLIIGAALLATGLVHGIPPAVALGRGIASNVWGCPAATELRMLANPETVTSARGLAGEYEQATADANYGCPTTDVYVYAGATDEIRARLETKGGWSDASDALREIGPRPDVYLAVTSHELDLIRSENDSETEPAPIEPTPIATSPVVLAVPAAAAGQEAGEGTWTEMFGRFAADGVPVVRAAPGSSELGMLATALLYGPADQNGPANRSGLEPANVEQYIAQALDGGDFPLTGTLGLLCRHRTLGSQAAVVASEQQVVLFDRGDPLGESCPQQADSPGRLVARYPSDTAVLDHQFVTFGWSGPQQHQAAAGFRSWLQGDAGRAAIVGVGLRPIGPYSQASGLTTPGVEPGAVPLAAPLEAQRWDAAAEAYKAAQRRGRVLFVLDTSGSMGAAVPGGTRWSAAAAAVRDVLDGMGPRDEFGIWLFPDAAGTGHVEAVAPGPSDPGRVREAEQQLQAVRPVGNTPLLRAMFEGGAALEPAPERTDTVVVVADGADNVGGVDVDALSAQVAVGVRLTVVAIGELQCSGGGLDRITVQTGGQCLRAALPGLDSALPDLGSALESATAGSWGGG